MNGLADLLPVETGSADETRALGGRLAPRLPHGTVLALYGDLGAGKTHLVKGLVAGLGGDPEGVTSPTFTIVQEYRVDDGILIHVDGYRTRSEREFIEMGLEDFLADARLAAVEWPDKLGSLLPTDAVALEVAHIGGSRRRISLVGPGP